MLGNVSNPLFDFNKRLFWKGKNNMKNYNKKMVIEAFVNFDDQEEQDRILLQPTDMKEMEELIKYGQVIDEKFVIEYERLKELAQEGWKCFYNRREDGHNGKSFVRYHHAFGDNREMLSFAKWEKITFFVVNRENQALLFKTEYEETLGEEEKAALFSDIEDFLLEERLKELGINGDREADRKAFLAIREDFIEILRQLMYCGYAKIIFDNGYLQMEENYPLSRFYEVLNSL